MSASPALRLDGSSFPARAVVHGGGGNDRAENSPTGCQRVLPTSALSATGSRGPRRPSVLGLLGPGLTNDRAAVYGGPSTRGVAGVHRLEHSLARSHVIFGGKPLYDDGRALVGIVKELDSKRHNALRWPSSLLETSLEPIGPFRVDIREADNSYVH
jgi:hypothetical protein